MRPWNKKLLILMILAASCSTSTSGESGDSDAGTGKDAGKESEIDAGVVPDYACRYENTFSKADECKEYYGGWSEKDAETDCADVFAGISGELNRVACDKQGTIGSCTVEMDDGRYHVTWYYGGDLEVTKNMCESFMEGTWDGEGDDDGSGNDPMDDAMAAMKSNDEVEVSPECTDDDCLDKLVEERKGISFSPRKMDVEAGLIFFPGGDVDPRAYAPVAQIMAAQGMHVVTGLEELPQLCRSPLRQGVFDRGRALEGDDVGGRVVAGDPVPARVRGPILFEFGDPLVEGTFPKRRPAHELSSLAVGPEDPPTLVVSR